VLRVLDWFAVHPRPGLYLRQLDIPGLHTKFVETHRALIAELLDRIAFPARLAADERALFDDLSYGRWGERARLEQERIGYGWVEQALAKLRER
jgi:hypothetical protein